MRPRRRELIHAITVSSQLSTWHHKGSHKLQDYPYNTTPLRYTLVNAASWHEPAGTLERNRHMRYSSSSAEGIILPASRTQDLLHVSGAECKRASRIVSQVCSVCHRLVGSSLLSILMDGGEFRIPRSMLSAGSESRFTSFSSEVISVDCQADTLFLPLGGSPEVDRVCCFSG